jgi:hypothetical protein
MAGVGGVFKGCRQNRFLHINTNAENRGACKNRNGGCWQGIVGFLNRLFNTFRSDVVHWPMVGPEMRAIPEPILATPPRQNRFYMLFPGV